MKTRDRTGQKKKKKIKAKADQTHIQKGRKRPAYAEGQRDEMA